MYDLESYWDLENIKEARWLLSEGLQVDSHGRLEPASQEDIEQQEVVIKLASASLEESYDKFLSGK